MTVNANSDDAVGPCAQTGTIDVTTADHDLCVCGETAGVWSVASFDNEIFVTASVTAAGVLTWITQGPDAMSKQYGSIILRFCCGTISAYMSVIIGIKDLCTCPECEVCEECNPCDGLCLDQVVDMTIEGVTPAPTS